MMGAREFAKWFEDEKKAARARAAEGTRERREAAAKESQTVTTTVRASGTCIKCGQLNWANIPATGTPGSTVIATATVSCGDPDCDGTFGVSGQGVIRGGR